MKMANVYEKAINLSQQVEFFFAAAVGRDYNKLEEFSLLVEWDDAAKAAQAAALAARDWKDVAFFDAMVDECAVYLEIYAEEAAA
jgi:hypothetical protein